MAIHQEGIAVTPLDYDNSRTALVLVDPYQEFLSEGGKIWPLVKEVAEAVGLHQHLRDLLGAVRGAGIPVFIAPHRRFHPGDFDNWRHRSRPHRVVHDGRFCEVGTFGAQWHPEFGPQDGDVVSSEHWGASGFAHTDLDQQLRQHGVEEVILAGMTAPGCVEATGRHGMELGYSITLVKDATAAFSKEYMHAAIELNGPLYANAVVPTDDVVATLVGTSR
jgi:nicotinamidase-related amidase